MISTVFFDCFGVLMLNSQDTLQQDYPQFSDHLTELSRQADAGFLSRTELTEQVAELLLITAPQANTLLTSGYHVNKELVTLIKKLRVNGVSIGLISNLGSGWFNTYVPADTQALFDDVVVSGDVGMVKPYPEIFALACNRLNVTPEECLFVDDSMSNCDGARRAGLDAVHFETTAQFNKELQKRAINI